MKDKTGSSIDIGRRDFVAQTGLLGGLLAVAGCAPVGGQPTATTAAPQAAPAAALPSLLPAGAGSQSQRAMETLASTMREISIRYFAPERRFTEPLDVAEGQRFLLHLLSAATDFYLEGDPARPWFVSMVSPIRKYLGDNPDARYFFAPLHSDRYYRITGRRKGREYISYTVHGGSHEGNWNAPGISHINHREIYADPSGLYEILLGPQKPADFSGNFLSTEPGAAYIVSRHYYENEKNAAADPMVQPELRIEAEEPPGPPPLATDAEIAKRLQAVANFLRVSTLAIPPPTPETVPAWWSLVPNQMGKTMHFGSNQDEIGLGAIDNTYSAGPYVLKPGQALLMEGRMPTCFFANAVLWNRFLQSDDYRYRQVSLNRQQMRLGADGSYRIAVSPKDPGGVDWLDTGGRLSGLIQWRFLLAEGQVEQPRTRLVPIEQAAGS